MEKSIMEFHFRISVGTLNNFKMFMQGQICLKIVGLHFSHTSCNLLDITSITVKFAPLPITITYITITPSLMYPCKSLL